MRVKITQLHKQLKAEGQNATMIYVTHDQVEAMIMGGGVIYFMLVDNQYTARIPVAKSTGANFNQIEEFVFGMDKCHIFDIETEKNLTLE